MAAPEPDYDLDEFRPPEPDWVKGLGKGLPKLPKLGLPMAIPGLPLLPNFMSMLFTVDAKTPKFVKDAAEAVKHDNLYQLIVETGLDQVTDVDLDLDLTVGEVAAAIRKAAGDLGPGAAGKIASGLDRAIDVDLGELVKAPKLPKLGLPMAIPGLPLLPSFLSMFFSVEVKTPQFIKDVADDVKYDNLNRLIVETGLDQIVDVDLDVDLTVEEVAAAIRKAAGDLGPGAAGKIASAVAEAMDADLGDFIKAPKLPKLGLPMAIPGLPLLPDFASLDFPLGAGDPLEHLASWLKE